MKIYLVYKESGEYDDYRKSIIKAFSAEEHSINYVKQLADRQEYLKSIYDQMVNIGRQIEETLPKIPYPNLTPIHKLKDGNTAERIAIKAHNDKLTQEYDDKRNERYSIIMKAEDDFLSSFNDLTEDEISNITNHPTYDSIFNFEECDLD